MRSFCYLPGASSCNIQHTIRNTLQCTSEKNLIKIPLKGVNPGSIFTRQIPSSANSRAHLDELQSSIFVVLVLLLLPKVFHLQQVLNQRFLYQSNQDPGQIPIILGEISFLSSYFQSKESSIRGSSGQPLLLHCLCLRPHSQLGFRMKTQGKNPSPEYTPFALLFFVHFVLIH